MYKRNSISVNIFIAFLFLNAASCKRPGKKVIDRFKDGSIGILYDYPDLRDTSTYTYWEYYRNGKVHQKLFVEKNKIIGTPTTYYPNGQIFTVDSLFHPRDRFSESWDGIMRRYYENGAIAARFEVKHGMIEGLAKVYNTQGILLKEYHLINDSIKNGEYKEFYPNGEILVKANYQDNALNGMMYYFKQNGDTSKYYNNKKGEKDMPYKKWLNNGIILSGNYVDKSETAVTWKWYSPDGKLIKKETRTVKNGEFVAPE